MTDKDREVLRIAAARLDHYADSEHPHGDCGTIQLAGALRKMADREA